MVRKVLQLVLGCSQPSCPAAPSAQTDGTLLGLTAGISAAGPPATPAARLPPRVDGCMP